MRPTETATGELRREHELILKVVNALDRRLEAAMDAQPPSVNGHTGSRAAGMRRTSVPPRYGDAPAARAS